VIRLLLAGMLLAAALVAGALALDVRAWRDELAAGDARFAVGGTRESWHADGLVPGAAAGRLLDVDDDRRVRDALLQFRRASVLARDPLRRQEAEGARSAATRALAHVAAGDDAVAAAQASVLLGVLGFDRTEGPERAVAAFRNALQLDPANEPAAYDLELALRVLVPVGTREGDSGGGPPSGRRRGAGGGDPGGGY
jgi:hypothetical protein